ncbi:uncharacterized protein LOC106134972 isoform X1 [Amyelois transitella]|uniref:uncharacterized protein LOC106134972 isoform X1 n=1 Tax=Amyelois transitella TaxID=680683 RepID=UPI00299037A2|nr:uncharacterized protein LOC106134972 isoform X1 [Amyelois transitella]
MQKLTKEKRRLNRRIRNIQRSAIERGLDKELLKHYNYICNYDHEAAALKGSNRKLILISVTLFILLVISGIAVNTILSSRCVLPSNYLVWEATRPLADCVYCENVTKPIILQNVTRRNFASFAYSSKPIIVKNAIKHWKAAKELNFNTFKQLYQQTVGSYESLEEGCQFLNFKTDLFTLKEVFEMPEARIRNDPGEKPWYVGWGNCHPDILSRVRQYYSVPEFLPQDAEFPATENIFFGYEMGAVMHLDYIPRLMWQGQVRGNKTWSVAPVPECDHICHKFEYYVEPGDVVLLDTRIWYHATSIPKGQFSLTVQSEYG